MLTLRPFRLLSLGGALAVCLLCGSEARAQFANHSLGLETAGVYVANPDALNSTQGVKQTVGSGGQIGIDATLYIDGGFDFYIRVLVGIHQSDRCNGLQGCQVVGVVPALGFRYLLLEDTIRPYLGLTVGYLAFFTAEYDSRFAISPMGGVEFFISDSFSIGPQIEYHLMLELNQKEPAHAVIGVVRMGWYF